MIDFRDPNWPEKAIAKRRVTVESAADSPFAGAAVESRLHGGPRQRAASLTPKQAKPRRSKRWATYGPGSRAYQTQLVHQAQNGRCANAGCNVLVAPVGYGRAMDRDPQTGKPLGILCKACSVALGLTRRNPMVLRGLIDYLFTHSQK